MNNYIKTFCLWLALIIAVTSCGSTDFSEVFFRSSTEGLFTLEASEEAPIEAGEFVWVNDVDQLDSTTIFLEDFNLAKGNINTVVPEDVQLFLLDEGVNWQSIRTIQLYIYNADATDSVLIARLDTIETNVNNIIPLNANNESLKTFVFEEEFRLRTLLETRAAITTNLNFLLFATTRVRGEL